MVFSIKRGFCLLLVATILISINTDRLADVRYACVRCGLGSMVGCSLFFSCILSVDKRRMVPFGGTDFIGGTKQLL